MVGYPKKISLVFLCFFSLQILSFSPPHIIYGDDNRVDINRSESYQQKRQSLSVALVLNTKNFIPSVLSHSVKVKVKTLGEVYNLCEEEPFSDQASLGFCTGFLIADDYLLTAGHCVKSEANCRELSFLFSYTESLKGNYKDEIRVSKNNIYSCDEVLFHGHSKINASLDFAVIKLDRKVKGRSPLVLTKKSDLSYEDEFLILGHPLGLPLKLADSGFLREELSDHHFTATLDTYTGNSGSPVLSKKTGFVEGVLIKGGGDFVRKGDCLVSSHCSGPLCPGELVLRSSSIIEHLPGDFSGI